MGESDPKKGIQQASVEEYRLVPVEQGIWGDEDERIIDVVGVLRDLWDNRATIIKSLLVFLTVGLLIYAFSERMYYAETSLMPEARGQSQTLRLFQQYQNLFGMQQNATQGGEIGISLYPELVESRPFLIDLIRTPVYFESYDSEITLFDYFNEVREPSLMESAGNVLWNVTFGLPSALGRLFSSSGESGAPGVDFSLYDNYEEPQSLDARIRAAGDAISKWTTVRIEPQTGFIIIGVSMPDASAAADAVQAVKEQLQAEIIAYRTERANNYLDFAKEEFDRIQSEYLAIQDSLADHLDSNINPNTARAQFEQERLETEYQRLASLYNSASVNLNEAETQLREEMPVFREYEPVFIPGKPASPDLAKTLAGSVFLGLFFGILTIFTRRIWIEFYRDFKSKGTDYQLKET